MAISILMSSLNSCSAKLNMKKCFIASGPGAKLAVIFITWHMIFEDDLKIKYVITQMPRT